MWQYQNTDELYHYGVLGMKWGIRRAYNKGQEYNYKSHGQKKYQKKFDRLSEKLSKKDNVSFSQQRKLDKISNKLASYKGRDLNRVDYAKNTNIGKAAVKTIIFGPLGTGNYNRFRSSGHGRIVSALGANFVASTIGYPLTALISKSAENRNGRNRARAEGNIISKKESKAKYDVVSKKSIAKKKK